MVTRMFILWLASVAHGVFRMWDEQIIFCEPSPHNHRRLDKAEATRYTILKHLAPIPIYIYTSAKFAALASLLSGCRSRAILK